MKKSLYAFAFLALVPSLLLVSCGPGKKLLSSRARVDQLENVNANKQDQLNTCNEQMKKLKEDNLSLQNENTIIQKDLKALSSESMMTIADQAKRLKSLQDMIQAQKDLMLDLRNSIASALMNYKKDELSVYTKDGNVYVSLQEKLLFKSGSDVVDPKGRQALKSLAQVLNNTNNISVLIEGHTDNVPIKTKLFQDNWDLSTARATSIVRILTTDNGFDPNRITATGRSEFHPVDSNDTADGRAANRRTEVILSPDLNELYKLLNQ